jgi:hypothetical protein
VQSTYYQPLGLTGLELEVPVRMSRACHTLGLIETTLVVGRTQEGKVNEAEERCASLC